MTTNNKTKDIGAEFKKLLADDSYLKIPKVGDIVKGHVLSASKKEVRLDIEGFTTGIVRGRELYQESPDYADLKTGDEVEATVVEIENENGEMELSFRFAGHRKVWDSLIGLKNQGLVIPAKILDANKGGLMVEVNRHKGFLPVSQLISEHYPRVQGGDKGKILEKLKQYVGQSFNVKVIDISENDDKLIVSEKAAWEEAQKEVISKYKVGDTVAGKITAVTDFGAFIEFDNNMEGLIHISEIAWQRIDDPRDFLKVGDQVKAAIINIDGAKIFLSIKKLIDDPWKNIEKKYQIGKVVKGKVIKANPFGLFVELDPEIHGLAHVSELSDKPNVDVKEIAKPGDTVEFKIISIEPTDHRLGLSIRALKESTAASTSAKATADKKAEDKTEAKKEEATPTEKTELSSASVEAMESKEKPKKKAKKKEEDKK
jgi:small subunit ribosomal protein S1